MDSRQRACIPVTLPDGNRAVLPPGAHSRLQVAVIEEFLPRFAPKARLLYFADTEGKSLGVSADELYGLGIPIGAHDKLPGIVAHHTDRNWLLLIEAVTSHGPVSARRHVELEGLLAACNVGRIYVSAFLHFREFKRHAHAIAWDTDVWIAAAPTHLVHYNGDRFFGPRQ